MVIDDIDERASDIQHSAPPVERLAGLTLPELRQWAISRRLPAFRGAQIHHALYQRLATTFDHCTDLPRDLRARLAEHGSLTHLVVEREVADPGSRTTKTLFRLDDGALVESVLMGYQDARGHRRHTICLSSQVGCALRCAFCATGQMGWARDLTAAEMVEQVLYFARQLRAQGDHVTNIVYMGMGEPFLNYDQVMRSVRILTEPDGFNLGDRHLTISTSGVVPAIKRFTAEQTQVGLAVSLHAAEDALRSQLVPLNRRYPLAELMQACRAYVSRTRRRMSFEYTMLAGVNDSEEQAYRLGLLLKGTHCHVNLIPWNYVEGMAFHPSSREAIAAFRDVLAETGIPVTIRDTRGSAITAACGQLRTITVRARAAPRQD